MTHLVSATFKTSEAVQTALARLEDAGFSERDISMLASDRSEGHSFNIEQNNKSAAGGSLGGAAGGLVGAVLAGFAATGAFVVPGINLAAYGLIFTAAAGGGVGAAAGGLAGALIGLGIPAYEAKRYEDEIKNGAYLIVVDAASPEAKEKAEAIMHRIDAHNIKS